MSFGDAGGGVSLRPAVTSDVEEITTIWHLGWRDGHLGHVPDEVVAVRTEASFRTRTAELVSEMVVARVGDHLAGFLLVVGDEVEQVYVASIHRGAGVADTLLAAAEQAIGADGHPAAWLAVVPGNARARRFYERRGWADAGPIDYEAACAGGGTVTVPSRRYEKQLG